MPRKKTEIKVRWPETVPVSRVESAALALNAMSSPVVSVSVIVPEVGPLYPENPYLIGPDDSRVVSLVRQLRDHFEIRGLAGVAITLNSTRQWVPQGMPDGKYYYDQWVLNIGRGGSNLSVILGMAVMNPDVLFNDFPRFGWQ